MPVDVRRSTTRSTKDNACTKDRLIWQVITESPSTSEGDAQNSIYYIKIPERHKNGFRCTIIEIIEDVRSDQNIQVIWPHHAQGSCHFGRHQDIMPRRHATRSVSVLASINNRQSDRQISMPTGRLPIIIGYEEDVRYSCTSMYKIRPQKPQKRGHQPSGHSSR